MHSHGAHKEIDPASETVQAMERVLFQKENHFRLWEDGSSKLSWLDRFCSSPFWGVPLREAFQAEGDLVCYVSARGNGLAVFCEREVHGGTLIMPADGMWLLGSPILGLNPHKLLLEVLGYWQAAPLKEGLRQILISGLYPQHPLLQHSLLRELEAWEIEPSGRMVASLEGGVEGFMSRRSKNFRSRLRRTVKASREEGLLVEAMPHSASPELVQSLLQRIFSLETRSWKGQAQRGIDSGSMRRFYELMIPLLAAEGRLRGLFLTLDGEDQAYLFGAMFDGYFRGLQFSYRAGNTLGLGNVCQYHMICRLVEDECTHYDLGQAMDYKARWAEEHIYSRSFVFQMR